MKKITVLILSIISIVPLISKADNLTEAAARIRAARAQVQVTPSAPQQSFMSNLGSNVAKAASESVTAQYPNVGGTCNFMWRNKDRIATGIVAIAAFSVVKGVYESWQEGYKDWKKKLTDIVSPPLKVLGLVAAGYLIYNYAPFTLAF